VMLSNENIFYRMKIYFIEWKYISSNENIFYRMKIYFIEWKYISSNENIFYRMKIYFIEWRYFNIELCYFFGNHTFIHTSISYRVTLINKPSWLFLLWRLQSLCFHVTFQQDMSFSLGQWITLQLALGFIPALLNFVLLK